MCIQTNNMFMNYSNCMMNSYMPGYNIADLFSGVSGINTIFNFGNMGYSNFGYGLGMGCCGSNWNWGWAAGTSAVGIVSSICTTRANNSRAEKAKQEAQDAKDIKNLEQAMTTLGLTREGKTKAEVLAMSKDDIDKLEIKDERYNKKALDDANKEVIDAKTDLDQKDTAVTEANNNLKTLKQKFLRETNTDEKEILKKEIENAELALTIAKENKTEAEKTLKAAEEKVQNIINKQQKFGEAQKAVKEVMEHEENKKKELEDKKKNRPLMGLFKKEQAQQSAETPAS